MHLVQRSLMAIGLSFFVPAATANVIFQESFEGSPAYTVENGGSNGSSSFFTVLSTSMSTLSLGYTVANIHGSSYFGARDLNGFGSTTPHRITFTTQDVAAYQNVSVAIALSARDGNNRFEAHDVITFEYSIDGGARYTPLGRFTGNIGGSPLSNGSASLLPAFADFVYAVPEGVSLLTLRLTADTFADSDEAVAFDNIRILGDKRQVRASAVAVPEPTNLFLAGLLMLGGHLLRRQRSAGRTEPRLTRRT